jgi:UDP-N-acetyl-D-galactosamine dehydrogenase
VVSELTDFGVIVDIVDPGASAHEVKEEYGLDIKKEPSGKYDAVIVAVSHKEYLSLNESFFAPLLGEEGIIVDVKGLYRGKIKSHTYWSL